MQNPDSTPNLDEIEVLPLEAPVTHGSNTYPELLCCFIEWNLRCYRLAASPAPALWFHCLQWGKDKTASGTGRVIPLSQRAMATLTFWATHFPERKPHHYVFPAERYGAAGDQFCAKAYDVDPSKPIGSIKEAWEAAKVRAGRILKGVPERTESEEKIPALVCRFHDLRHTAVSRMLNAGIPIAKVAKIAGWSPATMVRMAARYGHFSLNELREAVESISGAGIRAGSPVFSPVSKSSSAKKRAN